MGGISAKAEIANPAGLAKDVQVGPFSLLGPEVSVGPGTVIANNVTITGRTRIGANCRLFPGCVIGQLPADVGWVTPDSFPALPTRGLAPGRCTIEDGNTIREHVIIEAGIDPAGPGTHIGPGNLLMVACQVGHDAYLVGKGIFVNFTQIEHHARIEPFVQTGAFASVKPYATMGAYTFTTGYAGIDRDAPPYVIVHGYPFRVRNINAEKLRRCGFDAATIDALKHAFRSLFDGSSDSPSPESLSAVERRFDNDHVRRLVDSLRQIADTADGRVLQPGVAQ